MTLVLTARLGKSKAAELLNVTVPALNGRISTLEKRLQGSVFDGPRGKTLTPLGNEVRKLWTPQLQQMLEVFLKEIERLHDQNDLRISVDSLTWEAEGKRLQSAYAKRMPLGKIHVSFESGNLAIENGVREGRFDLGLVSFPSQDSRILPPLKRHFWCNEPMVLVVAHERADRLSDRCEVRREGFARLHHTFLTMPENTEMYNVVSSYLKTLKLGARCFDFKIPVQDADAALALIAEDRGVSILPERAAANAEIRGNVVLFLLKPPLQRRLKFLYRENRLKAASVNAFLACLDEAEKPLRRTSAK